MISPARGRVIGFIQYPRPQAAPERGPDLFERLGVEHAATLRNSTGAEQCSRTRSLSGMDAPAVLVCFRWLFRPELTLLLLDASDPPLRRALHITYAKNRPASPLDSQCRPPQGGYRCRASGRVGPWIRVFRARRDSATRDALVAPIVIRRTAVRKGARASPEHSLGQVTPQCRAVERRSSGRSRSARSGH